MRFHFVMLVIVILVSLGMHGMASAAVSSSTATDGDPSRATSPALMPRIRA
jgi:hypothetical protein